MSAIAALGDAVATGLTTRVVVVNAPPWAVGAVDGAGVAATCASRRAACASRATQTGRSVATLFSGGVESIATLHLRRRARSSRAIRSSGRGDATVRSRYRRVTTRSTSACSRESASYAVRIVFAAGTPTRWVAEDSYGVDTGLRTFHGRDDGGAARRAPDRIARDAELLRRRDRQPAHRALARSSPGRRPARRTARSCSGAWAMGSTRPYWGLDASDTPLCLS